ncbi:hypothetical protein SAMN05421505_12087 [Sinosporangium album]|uniref:HNH endonuclease n=1 Tax=Sinosporangium album TaxID=504805 RepID=A0A1G8EG40_9ACTN|nr:hypothetical protein [Sinosporangium album]SDH68883.1 hypothetical protein SAMN05421505_12087 [Sinosporangium album]
MRKRLDTERVMRRIHAHLAPGSIPIHAPHLGACTMWTRTVNDAGYAILWTARRKLFVARWMFEQTHGPLLAGLEPDHLCHDPDYCPPGPDCPHRRCINLAHLKAATHRENTIRSGAPTGINARKEWCDGEFGPHDLSDPANVYVRPSRPHERECEPCRRQRHLKNIGTRREQTRRAIQTAGGHGTQMSLLD